MNRVLLIVAMIAFSTTIFVRTTDPIIPQIADGFQVSAATAALLTTAFALPYALVQPVLGAMADIFGKARLMILCAVIGVAATFASAVAPTFEVLILARVVAGVASGGVFPVAVAIVGDLFAVAERQVAIGRVLATGMLGNLVGATLAGIAGDLWDWRAAFLVTGLVAATALLPSRQLLQASADDQQPTPKLATAVANYRDIFANPLAKICFGSVFLNSLVVFGLFPYLATLLASQGETRATIAGVIIAGFGVGAIVYSFIVRRLLAIWGDRRLMVAGGCVVAAGLLTIPLDLAWPVQTVIFLVMGVAFFMLHGSIQVYATELAPAARSSAMAIHSSSFFFGQALGPIAYGLSFAHFGSAWTCMGAALTIAGVGVWTAATLRHKPVIQVPPPGRAG